MPEDKRDAAAIFAEHITKTKFEDLGLDVVESTKRSILDTLGVMLGATKVTPGIQGVAEMVKTFGGAPESTLLGFGGKYPAPMAAFGNAAMAHCLDYDDTHHEAGMHPSSPTVPAALAMAERLVYFTGKDLITAVALGNDMSLRLILAVTDRFKFGWYPTPVVGYFGATAACCKVLGLGQEKVENAFGIALTQTSGSRQSRWEPGNYLGGMCSAFPAQAGILATLMAQAGVVAFKKSLEGPGGFFNLYYAGKYRRDTLLSELGTRFEGVNTGFKPWPACAMTHCYIDAVLETLKKHNLRSEDISQIVPYVGDYVMNLCEPLAVKRKPATTMDAKFSIPFTVAVAATKRRVTLGDYTLDALKNPAVLAMAQKVSPKSDAKYNVTEGVPGGRLELKTARGDSLVREVIHPYGHPTNPIAQEDMLAKFRECASFVVKPLAQKNVERAIDLLTHLEEVKDVGQIPVLLC